MTIEEIEREAENKFGIVRNRRVNGVLIKGDCELTKRIKRRAKQDYIKKKMIEFGHITEKNTLN